MRNRVGRRSWLRKVITSFALSHVEHNEVTFK